MKRFWIGLLSCALIMLFGTAVFAADAKFSGEFYLKGWYNKNHSLIDQDAPAGIGQSGVGRGATAFYTQRLRMGMNFQIAKGLRFATRFDALERKWMAARKPAPTGGESPSITTTDSEAENIAWEVAYVNFATPLGLFTVGSAPSGGCFGTCFGDAVGFTGSVISWANAFGPLTISASMKKNQDGVWARATTATPALPATGIGQGTDNDSESYTIAGSYRWKGGALGMAVGDVRARTANTYYTSIYGTPVYGRKTDLPYITLWAMQKFGKLFVEWEAGMIHFGHYVKYNEPKESFYQNVDPDKAWSSYLNINYDLSPFKIGFMFIHSTGDDPNTKDKREGGFRGILDLDRSFNPCLILWNEDYMQWMSPTGSGGAQYGTIYGNATGNPISTPMNNMEFFQIYGDFKATPKLTLSAAFTYAYANEKPTSDAQPVNATGSNLFLDDEYGKELDLTLKYKIYDNLEYMIGAAYLWTGDYFKGTNSKTILSNNYLITHKLTLTF
ncbi:MAG: hypothetical protein JW943_01680 [Deltaproteobacteria bacterium]|nr:hypothetical protein [Deltaproteobacteria bacterium]